MHAVGEVDELNAAVGFARVVATDDEFTNHLETIQSLLFDVGAELATPHDSPHFTPVINPAHAEVLEQQMDAMNDQLEPLKNFILPGGTELAARIHLARTVCRRAERAVITFNEGTPQRAELLVFLNRLSDWLFVLARWTNFRAQTPDVIWKRG
jgi:cob(I)alamin adenosyltransferase